MLGAANDGDSDCSFREHAILVTCVGTTGDTDGD